MYAIMNELSIRQNSSAVATAEAARRAIEEFADAYHDLNSNHYIEGLVSSPDLCSFELTSGYGVTQWLSSPRVDERYKRIIRSIINRCTWIVAEQYALSELVVDCGVSLEPAVGCLAAYENGEDVVSFATHDLWRAEQISGNYYSISEAEEEIQEQIHVRNYAPNRFEAYREKVYELLFTEIASGQDLWERKERLFPHLRFCDSVESQLLGDPERFHIMQVMKRLKRMDEYFASCKGVYDPKALGLYARTESETVQNDLELKSYRRFQLPDGDYAYFFDHIGFSGKYCGRIHYLPDAPKEMCYIGYIGRHLKTKKFKGG